MSKPSLETIHLTKVYDSVKAVCDLNLQIFPGEFFAFLGPNGAGKTTTIRMLTGLLKPTDGKIRICGLDPQESPIEIRRQIGYIPDNPYLYDKLTGYEFLHFVGSLFKIDRACIQAKGEELLHKFELFEYRNHLIETLSHGMKRRLIFCATLLHNPSVLLIDEPMVGLDPKSAKYVKDTLKNLTKEGVTIFLSTHTLSVAEELADRIGIIHEGHLIAAGSVEDLKKMGKNAHDLEAAFLAITEKSEETEAISMA